VFALGSSAYPYYCAFGKYLDNLLGELGGERLVDVACGDELNGQEQAFKSWAKEVFHVNINRTEKTTPSAKSLFISDGVRELLFGRRRQHRRRQRHVAHRAGHR